MKKTSLLILIIVVMGLITSCAKAADEPVLTVNGIEYTRTKLEALGTTTVDYTNKDGETTAYEGVVLATLLSDAGVQSGELGLVAADGYVANLTVEEALSCANCIVAFDDDSLRTVMPEMSGKLQVKDLVDITVN